MDGPKVTILYKTVRVNSQKDYKGRKIHINKRDKMITVITDQVLRKYQTVRVKNRITLLKSR